MKKLTGLIIGLIIVISSYGQTDTTSFPLGMSEIGSPLEITDVIMIDDGDSAQWATLDSLIKVIERNVDLSALLSKSLTNDVTITGSGSIDIDLEDAEYFKVEIGTGDEFYMANEGSHWYSNGGEIDIEATGGDIGLSATQYGTLYFGNDGTNNGNFFTDNEATKHGLQYASDYSANYTDRSLVDKEYVDSSIVANASTATNTDSLGNQPASYYASQADLEAIIRDTASLVAGTGITIDATDDDTITISVTEEIDFLFEYGAGAGQLVDTILVVDSLNAFGVFERAEDSTQVTELKVYVSAGDTLNAYLVSGATLWTPTDTLCTINAGAGRTTITSFTNDTFPEDVPCWIEMGAAVETRKPIRWRALMYGKKIRD